MRRINKIFNLLTLVLLASCFLRQLPVSAQGQMLTGEGHWDISMIQEYCKKFYHIDVPAAPAPYPQKDTKANGYRLMLDTLNPEFRKRVDALVAIYQAFCRNYNEHIDIGIVPGNPGNGALRTKEDQQNTYKLGRHQVPGTDGTHQQDWQPAHGPSGGLPPGASTMVWVGWHQLGVAVDFGHFVNGIYQNDESSVLSTSWRQTVEMASRLGLVPGFYWHSIHDPAHIEWHPGWDEGAVVNIGTPGVALTDEQIKSGYKWKLPEFIYKYTVPNASVDRTLPSTNVYHLVKDGDWIALKSMRTIFGRSLKDNWLGSWTQFSPPVRLFPAYIPVLDLWRTPLSCPDDKKWRASTCVVRVNYEQKIEKGTPVLHAEERTGMVSFLPDVRVRNYQMLAMEQYIKNDPYSASWKELLDPYIYSVTVTLYNDGTMPGGQFFTRDQDRDGYTRDTTSNMATKSVLGNVEFLLGWNHDTGEVGAPDITALDVNSPFHAYQLKPQSKSTALETKTYAASLPAGALDVEKPMYIRKNPKPPPPPPAKPVKTPDKGGNQFLMP